MFTREAIEERKYLRELVGESRRCATRIGEAEFGALDWKALALT
jgi:hypothetical protein